MIRGGRIAREGTLGATTLALAWFAALCAMISVATLLGSCSDDEDPAPTPTGVPTGGSSSGGSAAGGSGANGGSGAAIPDPLGPRGYEARACGFDLDDDGVVGEPEDCTLCDGQSADPDGDGIDEDLIYVDADGGSDTSGDGSPGSPFATIQHAWDQADGPGDGAEDIICFRGIATGEENVRPRVSGVAGVRTKPASGSEGRDWEYPANPTMLVGWDSDGDGAYPPFDTDDVAVLDGGPGGLTRAFELNPQGQPPTEHLEIAHLTVRDYGHTFVDDDSTGIGFVRLGSVSGTSSHLYLHDLELENINKDKPKRSSAVTFNCFMGSTKVTYLAIENIRSLETGGYFARGDFAERIGDPSGPVRFQRVTLTAHSCDFGPPPCGDHGFYSSATAFKIWGYLDGMEILDSVFDGNVAAWSPRPSGPTNGIIADGCVVDWVVRNNLVRNYHGAFSAKGTGNSGVVDNGGFCNSRPVDQVVIDRNIALWDVDYYEWGVGGVSMDDEHRATIGGSIANVTITNNFFIAPGGFRTCLNVNVSNDEGPAPGRITFAGNTCWGGQDTGLGSNVAVLQGTGTYPFPDIVIANNIFGGFELGDDKLALEVDYQPASFEVHHNVYSPQVVFRWLGTDLASLAAWQSTASLDTGSVACTPTFVSTDEHDLHLAPGDSCAAGAGAVLAGLDHDYDGDPRPLGAPDSGADEIE